jgi:DsbC/DsbD-like thiol-disulfide interchange protein
VRNQVQYKKEKTMLSLKPWSIVVGIVACLLTSNYTQLQSKPVRWNFSCRWTGPDRVVFIATATLAPGWHLYSQHLGDSGPLPTAFSFQPEGCTLLGSTGEEGHPITRYDSIYNTYVTWYDQHVRFTRQVRTHAPSATLSGTIEYMACSRSACMPDRVTFSLQLAH